jgi:hypothetical protein
MLSLFCDPPTEKQEVLRNPGKTWQEVRLWKREWNGDKHAVVVEGRSYHFKKQRVKPGIMVQALVPASQAAKAEGSSVHGQPCKVRETI